MTVMITDVQRKNAVSRKLAGIATYQSLYTKREENREVDIPNYCRSTAATCALGVLLTLPAHDTEVEQ